MDEKLVGVRCGNDTEFLQCWSSALDF